MQLASVLLVPLLLSAPLSFGIADGYAWSNANSPGGGPVQGIGGSAAVLVASTWSNGAYRSFDGGLRWEQIPDFPPVSEARVAFDPSDPLVGYVFGFGGVARTLDGGETWSHALDTSVTYRLAVSPSGAVAASMRDAEHYTHVVVSTDRGATWTDIGFPKTGSKYMALYGMAFGRTDDELVVMGFNTMWRTSDGGATWTSSSHSFLDLARAPDGTLWGAGSALRTSADGGATWQDVAAPAIGRPIVIGDDGRVFMATGDGFLLTTDGGASWQNLGSPDAAWGATQLAVDPHDAGAVFAADEFLGVSRVWAGGFEGRTTGLQPIDVYALGASADGSVLLAGSDLGLYVSRNGGESWSHTGAGAGMIGTWSVGASADGSVLIGGGQTRVFSPFLAVSRDAGATWQTLNPQLGGDGYVAGIAFAGASNDVAFAAANMELAWSKVIWTWNGGRTWEVILDIPFHVRDVAWDEAAGKLIAATELGVLEYQGVPYAWTPRGATLNTWTVAASGDRSWSNGPEVSIWSGAGTPHLPWADSGGFVLDLAPESSEAVWATNHGGALARCVADACAEASPPHDVMASLVRPDGQYVFAATRDGGIYRAQL